MSDLKPLNATHFRILDALRANGSVTPRSFRSPTIDHGDEIDRLAPRINELRQHDFNIETVMEITSRGKRFARYFLRGEPAASGVSSTPTEISGADLKTTGEAPEALALFDMPAAYSPYDEEAA